MRGATFRAECRRGAKRHSTYFNPRTNPSQDFSILALFSGGPGGGGGGGGNNAWAAEYAFELEAEFFFFLRLVDADRKSDFTGEAPPSMSRLAVATWMVWYGDPSATVAGSAPGFRNQNLLVFRCGGTEGLGCVVAAVAAAGECIRGCGSRCCRPVWASIVQGVVILGNGGGLEGARTDNAGAAARLLCGTSRGLKMHAIIAAICMSPFRTCALVLMNEVS